MKTLLPIEYWKSKKVERGRSTGSIIETRYVLAIDKWNICLAYEQKGKKQIVGEQFYGSIKTFIVDLQNHLPKINQKELLKKISVELTTLTGIDIILNEKENIESIAKNIDQVFGTNFHKESYPPRIFERLFSEECLI
jgi:hypothetical protein